MNKKFKFKFDVMVYGIKKGETVDVSRIEEQKVFFYKYDKLFCVDLCFGDLIDAEEMIKIPKKEYEELILAKSRLEVLTKIVEVINQ